MKRFRDIALGIVIAAVLVGGSFVAGLRLARPEVGPPFDRVLRAADELAGDAAQRLSSEELARAAIEGMLDALGDRYASLIDEEDRGEIQDLIDGTVLQSRLLDGRIAYVQLTRFGRGAAAQLRDAVAGLLDRGAIGLVLDLRDNPGGLAEEAYRSAGLFVSGGVVARVREAGEPERAIPARGERLPDVPMALLVDGGTASAAEILAGALQDRGRAVLVGLRTYGKGSVLAVRDLGSGGGSIQYTSAYFFTPDGHPVEGRGIAPDVVVDSGDWGDPQLDRAVAELGAMVGR